MLIAVQRIITKHINKKVAMILSLGIRIKTHLTWGTENHSRQKMILLIYHKKRWNINKWRVTNSEAYISGVHTVMKNKEDGMWHFIELAKARDITIWLIKWKNQREFFNWLILQWMIGSSLNGKELINLVLMALKKALTSLIIWMCFLSNPYFHLRKQLSCSMSMINMDENKFSREIIWLGMFQTIHILMQV